MPKLAGYVPRSLIFLTSGAVTPIEPVFLCPFSLVSLGGDEESPWTAESTFVSLFDMAKLWDLVICVEAFQSVSHDA